MALNNFFFQGQAGVPMAMDQMPRSIEEAAQINRVIAQMVGQQADASMPQGGPPGPSVPRDRILEMAQYEKTHPGMLSGGMSAASQSRSAYAQRPQMPMGQNAGLDRMRTANANFASDQQQPQIPPQIAQMLQQQTIDSQLPQNRPQLSPEQLGAPQGLDERRNTPADPTGFAARNSIGGQPPVDYQTQPINQEEQARLANLVASLQAQERPGFDSPTVLSGGGNAAMAGQASRLASMPGAQEVDIPGLAGSDNVTPGAGVRELWSRPGFQAAQKGYKDEQARRQEMVSDRARIKADMRDGITPQYRLIDQMVGNRKGGQMQQGGQDEFTRNAILYGPQVALEMANTKAKNGIADRQLGIQQQEADAKTKEVDVAAGMITGQQNAKQAAADSELAKSLIADPTSAAPGALNNIKDPAIRAQVIRGIVAKLGAGNLGPAIPSLDAIGADPAEVQRVVDLPLPAEAAPNKSVSLGAMAGNPAVIPNMIGNFFNNKRRANADKEHKDREGYFSRIPIR